MRFSFTFTTKYATLKAATLACFSHSQCKALAELHVPDKSAKIHTSSLCWAFQESCEAFRCKLQVKTFLTHVHCNSNQRSELSLKVSDRCFSIAASREVVVEEVLQGVLQSFGGFPFASECLSNIVWTQKTIAHFL